jgi:hypothetical protein
LWGALLRFAVREFYDFGTLFILIKTLKHRPSGSRQAYSGYYLVLLEIRFQHFQGARFFCCPALCAFLLPLHSLIYRAFHGTFPRPEYFFSLQRRLFSHVVPASRFTHGFELNLYQAFSLFVSRALVHEDSQASPNAS